MSTQRAYAVQLPTEVIKRDGRRESFRQDKVRGVLERCFREGLGKAEAEAKPLVESVTKAVMNVLSRNGAADIHIEQIQDKVIQQLWAAEQYEAATHFTLYREERRRIREQSRLDPAQADLIRREVKRFPTPERAYQFYSKFSRWREEDKRRETWPECVDRTFAWFATLPAFGLLTPDEVFWLREMVLDFKVSPAMRVIQMAGPALERCHMGAYNCAGLPIIDLRCFSELLYVLMQGSGCGFSVEGDFIQKLPRVKAHKAGKGKEKHRVEDTTEAWCDALLFGLRTWFAGGDVEFDLSAIRPKGARLKTKGGRASGPEPLRQLLDFTREVVKKAAGRRLTDLECHDIACMTGRIVQVGGVRRAACISLSDLDSAAMRAAKHGDWWLKSPQRSMANNSAVYESRPDARTFVSEMLALIESRSGERGIFSRYAAVKNRPARRKKAKFIGNPCLEILFRPFGLCNLTISVARAADSDRDLAEKVRAAAYLGVLQATATRFNYVRDEWRRNAEDERLIGVDLMGHLDSTLLKPGAEGRGELVRSLAAEVDSVAVSLSSRFGINRPAANTCLKPGGDSGVFFHSCTLGGYPSEYQIRRVREQSGSPVAKLLAEQGVPHLQDPVNPELTVFEFPRKNPEGCVTEGSMGAIEQLENWLFWKKNWAEHSCSVTVHVKDGEWPAVIAWLYEPDHFDHLTGVSFLPFDDHTYQAAPNERISREQYEELTAKFPAIDWGRLPLYESEDMTESSQTLACSAGGCNV